MRTTIALAVAFSAAALSARAAPLPAPITPASEGKLQCYAPNLQTKSCRSLASYERGPNGAILNPSTVLIASSPLVTMTATTPVEIKNGQVCGKLSAGDVAGASFQVNGQPATADQITKLRGAVTAAMSSVFGKEICTAYVTANGAITSKASVDGVAMPEADQAMIWVSPSDGYKVQP